MLQGDQALNNQETPNSEEELSARWWESFKEDLVVGVNAHAVSGYVPSMELGDGDREQIKAGEVIAELEDDLEYFASNFPLSVCWGLLNPSSKFSPNSKGVYYQLDQVYEISGFVSALQDGIFRSSEGLGRFVLYENPQYDYEGYTESVFNWLRRNIVLLEARGVAVSDLPKAKLGGYAHRFHCITFDLPALKDLMQSELGK